MRRLRNHIDGAWVDGASDDTIDLVNPATEEVLATLPAGSEADVEAAVQAALRAASAWAGLPLGERLEILSRAADAVEAHIDELAGLEAAEMGRPVAVGAPSIRGAAGGFRRSLELARSYPFESEDGNTLVQRHPVGVVALITPWNYPSTVILTEVAPALAAGNTVVLKPSEKAALSAVRLVELLDLPSGVLNLVLGDGRAGGPLSSHPAVGLVNFTGSVPTGRAIATASATHLRRAVLELGGKDPAIVDAGVDVEAVAKDVARGAFENTGQICTSMERIYVHRDVADAFVAALVEEARAYRHGDPAVGAVMGPMVDGRQRDIVISHVDDAVRRGATVRTGGAVPDGTGYFYPATVLTDVTDEMVIMREETFGPVAPIQIVDSFDDALEKAKGTAFGLGATVYTNDADHAAAARDLPAGIIWINRWQGPASRLVFEPARQSGVSVTGHTASLDAVTRPSSVVRNAVA